MKTVVIGLVLICCVVAAAPTNEMTCAHRLKTCNPSVPYFDSRIELNHASTVQSLNYFNTHVVIVKNWTDWSGPHVESILLIRCGCPAPSGFENHKRFWVPVESAFVEETVAVPKLYLLGQRAKLTAIASALFVTTEELLDDVHNGFVFDIQNNYTNLLSAPQGLPQILITGTGPTSSKMGWQGSFDAIRWLDSDPGEATPLGRAELIKLYGIIFGVEDTANGIFDLIESRYQAVREAALHSNKRPSVMVGVPFFWNGKSSWTATGGLTYVGRLLQDAMVEYKFAGLPSASLSPSQFLERFSHSQFWINAHYLQPNQAEMTLDALVRNNHTGHPQGDLAIFKQFTAFKCGNVYAHDGQIVEGLQGNPYWEEGVLRPDIILSDLVQVFHGVSLTSDRQLHFYRKLAPLSDFSGVAGCDFVNLPLKPSQPGSGFVRRAFTISGISRSDFLDKMHANIKPAMSSSLEVPASNFEFYIMNEPAPVSDTQFSAEVVINVEQCSKCSGSSDSSLCKDVYSFFESLSSSMIQKALGAQTQVAVAVDGSLQCANGKSFTLKELDLESGLSGGEIAGIVIGSIVLLLAIAAGLFFAYKSGYKLAYKKFAARGPEGQALKEVNS